MLFELHHLLTAPLGLLAIGLTWLLAYRLARAAWGLEQGSEAAGAAAVVSVLVLNLQVWGLSLLPIERPLDWIPLLHALVLVVGWIALRRMKAEVSVRKDFYANWNALSGGWKTALSFGGLVWLIYLLLGSYLGLGGADELSYHGPQAIMLFQEGRLTDFAHPLPWVSSYPRGAANLWGWTMFWTRADILFHPVQALLTVQFVAHSVALAAALGAPRTARIALLVGLLCMPLVFKLSVLSTADLCFAAATCGVVVFGLKAVLGNERLGAWRDVVMLLAFAQAAAAKIPIVAGWAVLVVVGCRLIQGWRTAGAPGAGRRAAAVGLALFIVLIACHSYLINWYKNGNPLYPIKIVAAGRVVFDGPHPPAGNVGVSSTMGAIGRMSLPRQYHAAWFDWYAPLTEDSLGSGGPVLAAWMPLMLIFFLGAWQIRRPGVVLLLATTTGWLLLPGFFAPRYSLAWMGCTGAMAAAACGPMARAAAPAVRLMLLAGLAAIPFTWSPISETLRWVRANNQGWFSRDRTSRIAERYAIGFAEIYPSPEMIQAIRSHCGPNSILAWNVSAYQSLLWNRSYSNRVVFLPGHPAERYPSGPHAGHLPDAEQVADWRSRLEQERASHVLVYQQTPYSEALAAAGSGFTLLWADPPAEDRLGMALYRREEARGE